MNFLRSWRTRALSVLLLAGAGLANGVGWREHTPEITPLFTIGAELGDWRMAREQAMEQDVVEYLKPDEYLYRWYSRSEEAPPVSLYIAYFKSQQTGLYPHSPRHCLPGSGWLALDADILQLANDGGSVPVNRYVLEKNGEKIVVVYWYQTSVRAFAREIMGKVLLVPDLLRLRRSDIALVRVIATAQSGDVAERRPPRWIFPEPSCPKSNSRSVRRGGCKKGAMRILFLSASGQLGGAERSLIEMITSLRRAEPGWAIGVVVSEDGPLVHRARELGAEVQVAAFPDTLARLGDSGLGSAHAAARFLPGMARAAFSLGPYCGKLPRGAMRAFAPDVIHSNGFKMHVLGLRCRPDDTPLIWHIHDYVSPRRLMKMLTRRLASSCALAVANSDSVAQDVRAVYGNAISVRRVYNAIDTQRFSPQGGRLDLDGLAGLPEAAPGVIRVGLPATFARWKGHSVFLQAIARLAADSPVRAYVIGGGVYRTAGSQFTLEELRAEASRLGVSDRVGFTGFVEDAAAAMRSLDIVVHASTQPEPFGMVIIEAMACGRPVRSELRRWSAGNRGRRENRAGSRPRRRGPVGATDRDPGERRPPARGDRTGRPQKGGAELRKRTAGGRTRADLPGARGQRTDPGGGSSLRDARPSYRQRKSLRRRGNAACDIGASPGRGSGNRAGIRGLL